MNIPSKKKLLISAAAVLAIVFAAILFMPKGMSGTYKVSAFIYDGWNLSSDASGSYVKVNGIDNGKKSEMYVRFDNLSNKYSGYIDTVAKYSNYTKYKYTITSDVGNLFDRQSYYYLSYYKKGDYIVIQGDGLEIRFSKQH